MDQQRLTSLSLAFGEDSSAMAGTRPQIAAAYRRPNECNDQPLTPEPPACFSIQVEGCDRRSKARREGGAP